MPEATVKDAPNVLTDEEKEKLLKKRTAEERAIGDEQKKKAKAARDLRLAENEAQKAMQAVAKNATTEKPVRVEDLSPEELVSEYDRWIYLSDRLKNSVNEDLRREVERQARDIRQELLTRGITADLSQHEISALADMPITYSADLLNNLTQAALGVSVIGDSEDGQIVSDELGIHVSKGVLTLEDTVPIAEEIAKAHPKLLQEKSAQIEAFGRNIRELSQFLAGQTVDGKGERSIFKTEEQQQAMVSLYNAGVWLEKLGNKNATAPRIKEWDALYDAGREYIAQLTRQKDGGAAQQAKLLGLLFGKTIAKGRVPTVYQRLLERHGKTEESIRLFLGGREGQRMVRLMAPFIAESFTTGKAARNIVRGVSQIEELAPKVVFDAARGKAGEAALPTEVVKLLRVQFGEIAIPDTRNLLVASREIAKVEKDPQRRLARLNDLVRHYQIPGEVAGNTVEGYQLARVYDNPNAEIGCAVRSYLLASAIQEAYKDTPENLRPQVMADTVLIKKNEGSFMGHTRLQVTVQSNTGQQTYVVDPSVNGLGRGNGVDTLENIRRAETGVVLGEWTGDVYESQEVNMILNLSQFAKKEDEQRMLQMALQKDPKNQMVLIKLAALSKGDPEAQRAYKEQILRQNPEIEKNLEAAIKASEGKFGVELANNIFQNAAINQVITDFYNNNGIPLGTDLTTLPYTPANLSLLRQLEMDLTREVNRTAGQPTFAADLTTLEGLVDRGKPQIGQPPPTAELARAMMAMERLQRSTPDGFWQNAQATMSQLEKDQSIPTGFGGGFEGNYRISTELRDQILETRSQGIIPSQMLDELDAELKVRTAAHDVVVIARLEGEAGANKMAQGANRMTSQDFAKVEALPGVAKVKELYEQQENYILALKGGLTQSDFDDIQREVERTFDAYVAAGIIPFTYNLATNPESYKLERQRALSVGRNLFIYKSRDAHFIALGSPDVMGGLGIGNQRLDFLVRLFSPGYWSIFRYGLANPHVAPIIEHIGRDNINRMLYLQDHDSSLWRVPAFIEALNNHKDAHGNPAPLAKQALFMRLYWLGETTLNPDQHDPNGGVGGQDDFLKHHTMEQLVNERRKLVDDIIHYVPEELASVFRGNEQITDILQDAHGNPRADYQQFLQDIALAREKCIAAGDYDYANFENYLQGVNELIPAQHGHPAVFAAASSVAIYNQLTAFFGTYRDQLADPDWEHPDGFKSFREAKQANHHLTREEWQSQFKLNPLFRQRVYSLVDVPHELIDMNEEEVVDPVTRAITIRKVVNTQMTNAFGGQDIGRELQNLGGASKTFGILAEYFTHPSMESIEKLKGTIRDYKGWGQDIIVRDEMFDGLSHYIKEDADLRILLPGLDVLLGKLRKGRSIAQREQGEWAEAYDTTDLIQLIKTAVSKGDISHHEADRLTNMAKGLPDLLGALQWFPQLQLLVFIIFVSFIKDSLNPKALGAAA